MNEEVAKLLYRGMKKKHCSKSNILSCVLLAATICGAGSVFADVSMQTEQSKLLKAPDSIVALDKDLFGDKVNLYNGHIEFIQTDVDLPGNNKLPVMVGRRFDTTAEKFGDGFFRHWDLEIPYIHGTFSQTYGWQNVAANGQVSNMRCTNFGTPPSVSRTNDTDFKGLQYWYGTSMYVPGIGDQEILKRDPSNTNIPNDGQSTLLVTKKDWAIRCLSSLASTTSSTPAMQAGEGFLAIAPDGTQYKFDWLVTQQADTLSKVSGAQTCPVEQEIYGYKCTKTLYFTLPRVEVRIYPTLVTDRFGNTVKYTYDPANKQKLLRIESSDGRTLTFTHETGTHFIRTVSDGTRTWTYNYGTGPSNLPFLTSVVLPDGSSWQLAGMDSATDTNLATARSGFLDNQIRYPVPREDDIPAGCENPLNPPDGRPMIGTMIHPSGARGTFTLDPLFHTRSRVPRACYDEWTPIYPAISLSYTLTKKAISGPGTPEMVWSYNYDDMGTHGYWVLAPNEVTADPPGFVLVTNPKGEVTRYTFGVTYGVDEGLLQRVDIGWNGSSALQSTSIRYNRSFTKPVGTSDQYRGDSWLAGHRMPEDQRLTELQGVTFQWLVPSNADFDVFARPKKVVRASSLGYSRTELIDYTDITDKWILGQVRSVQDDGTRKVMVLNDYNASTGLLEKVTRFGKLDESMSYYGDGTLETHKDGLNQATTYSSYMRGIPQLIKYADGTSESVVVNNIGKITSVTDQNKVTINIGYDAMGRVSLLSYPSADSVAWTPMAITFAQIPTQEFDLAPGHWRQLVVTGKRVVANYFDAFWRPVYTERWDDADRANTIRLVKNQYDFEGRKTFESYPKRTPDQIGGQGVYNEYDALGRPTVRSTISELDTVYDGYVYYPGYQTLYTDADGKNAVYTYQVFDQPTQDAVVSARMEEGVSLSIERDVFGKTKSITRSGDGLALTRSYVYDDFERLCKTVEPETGATIQTYDLADNVSWRATGLALQSLSSCDTASVESAKKTSFRYDARSRLLDTIFGDGSPAINRTYTLDGLLETVSSGGTKWTYGYNKRRLPEHETMVYGGVTYNIDRTYDANGSLSLLRYPGDNLTLDYNPNALGEPRQVGSYATAIAYHPSGAVASFTYGNGIRHTMEQNIRGLPKRTVDTGVLDDLYAYSRNGNVEVINDQLQGMTTRNMTYDRLNRLKTVTAPNLWGTATYGYDALDNLVSTSITGGQNVRTTVHNIDYATNRLTSITNGPAGFNFSYGYDAQGNIVNRGAQAYKFDQANRMTQAVGRATYVYDGLGRRVSAVGADGVNRIQVYSQTGQLLYSAPSNGVATKYIYLHNHQIAEIR